MTVQTRPVVLFVVPTLAAGGAERVFATLLRHVDTVRFDVRLVVFSTARAMFLDQIPAAVEVIDLGTPRVRQGLPRFLALLHRIRPAAVISTLEHLNQALCASRPFWPKGVRHVVRLTNVRQLDFWKCRTAARVLYPSADGLVFQSQAMRQAYESRLNYRHPNGVVIENPLDGAWVRRRAEEPAAPTGYEPGGVNLVAVGRYEPVKGFDLLAEALARTAADFRLTILGDGPDRAAFEALIDRLGLRPRVRLVGYQANPYPYLAEADGFVLSSRSEGFPNVVLEALACGTPVVATPVAGLEGFLAGVPGCQVAREVSVEALAEALDRFAAAPRVRAPAEAVAPFEAAAVARRYEAFLSDVIAGRRAAA